MYRYRKFTKKDMNISFGRSGYIPFRSTSSIGRAYKPLNKATVIRNKFCKNIYGGVPKECDEVNEDVINTHMLSPYCLMDVAYGMWQDLIKVAEFNEENKVYLDEIKLMWSNDIYGSKNVFFKGLSDNDIYELSEYADKLANHLEKSIKCLYNNIYSSLGFMKDKHREVYTTFWVIDTLLNVSISKFDKDWSITFENLEIINDKISNLGSAYLYQYYENNTITFKESIYKVIEDIHRKVVSIKYES